MGKPKVNTHLLVEEQALFYNSLVSVCSQSNLYQKYSTTLCCQAIAIYTCSICYFKTASSLTFSAEHIYLIIRGTLR
jgi:hypothetical protein